MICIGPSVISAESPTPPTSSRRKRATQIQNAFKSNTVTPTFCEAGISDFINLGRELGAQGEILLVQ